jgi:hypothetical protein
MATGKRSSASAQLPLGFGGLRDVKVDAHVEAPWLNMSGNTI